MGVLFSNILLCPDAFLVDGCIGLSPCGCHVFCEMVCDPGERSQSENDLDVVHGH